MAEREAMIPSPGLDEPADQDHRVDDRREDSPRQCRRVDEPTYRHRQRRVKPGVSPAGDGGVRAPPEPAPLGIEGAEREHEEHDREHGGSAAVVLSPDDRKENRDRQHVEIAAEDERVAEVGEALDEAEQERVGETGAHQRERDSGERAPAIGTERLCRLFHRWADAFHDTDEDEKGDGGEGEHLGEPDAGQTVEPARWHYPEGRLHERGDRARAAEEEDHGKTDHERGRDDGQHRQHAQRLLGSELRAGDDQRERKTERRAARRDEDAEEHGVPRHPASGRRDQAVEPPHLTGGKLGPELARREGAAVVQDGADEDARDRIEDEDDDEGDDGADPPADEPVAVEGSLSGDAAAEDHEERGADDETPDADAGLAAHREALKRDPCHAAGADGQQQSRAGAGASEAPDGQRSEEEWKHGEEREAPVKQSLDEGGAGGAIEGILAQPAEREDPVLGRVPRQDREGDPPGAGPPENGPIHGSAPPRASYCGSDLTSFPHFSRRRFRSAEEPNLTKS